MIFLGGKFGKALLSEAQIQELTDLGIDVLWQKDSNQDRDIGPVTIQMLKDRLESGEFGTFFGEGPLGQFEVEPFQTGTFEIIRAVAQAVQTGKIKRALISGGELGYATKMALGWDESQKNSIDGFEVSTGGGTSIAYLTKRGQLSGTKNLQDPVASSSLRKSSALGPLHVKTPGGIDLNSKNLNLKEKSEQFNFNFSPEVLKNILPEQVNGILPVITNITPVTNFPLLLGLSAEEPQKQLSHL